MSDKTSGAEASQSATTVGMVVDVAVKELARVLMMGVVVCPIAVTGAWSPA